MKKIVIIFNLLILFYLYSIEIKPSYLIDFTIDAGCGIYLGNFKEHLDREKAYWATPVLDFYFSFFIIKYLGIQLNIGSGCVIHPKSYPIEGTIIYNAIEIFFQYEWELLFIKIFTGAGFQHCTMLISYYSSGFFEAGFGIGTKINSYMSFIGSIKYRMGFLHSLLVYPQNLMSITFSIGLIFRIKNPFVSSS